MFYLQYILYYYSFIIFVENKIVNEKICILYICIFVYQKEYVKKFQDDINNLRKIEYENLFTQNELLRNDFLNHEKLTKEVQSSLEDAKYKSNDQEKIRKV